jgi:hypothetical protein
MSSAPPLKTFTFLDVVITDFDDTLEIASGVVDKMIEQMLAVFRYGGLLSEFPNLEATVRRCKLRESGRIKQVVDRLWRELILINLHQPFPKELESCLKAGVRRVVITLMHNDDTLYFLPFFRSTIFLYAFSIKQFPLAGSLQRYWSANPVEVHFVRDMCYFCALWYDPTLKYMLPMPLIIARMAATCEQFSLLYHQMNTDEKFAILTISDERMVAVEDDGDDDDDDDDDDISVASSTASSVRSVQSVTKKKVKIQSGRGAPPTSKRFSMYERVYDELLTMIDSYVPAKARRVRNTLLRKLYHVVLLLPYMLEHKWVRVLRDIICSHYASLSAVFPEIDRDTLWGIIIHLQFFTETHLNMVVSDLEVHRTGAATVK